jgi:NitT/TauT family transport system substrate-binding protein
MAAEAATTTTVTATTAATAEAATTTTAAATATASETTTTVSSAAAATTATTAAAESTTAADSAAQTAPDGAAEPVRVAAMKGPTGMGLVKLMQDSADGLAGQPYDFFIGTIDEIIPKISTGALDIAAVPANIAAVLYNNTGGKVKVIAINTLGVLYVVEKGESINSVADLKGRTIFASGKGTTPEYALNYVLAQNGLSQDDLTVEFKSEPAEIIPLLTQTENAAALLPQPFVATALSKVDGTRIALDWTAEWDRAATDGSALVTSVLVARSEFIEAQPLAAARFLIEFAGSSEYARSDVDGAAKLVGAFGIIDEAIARLALPYCNITCITGNEMKGKLSGYLGALFGQNPQSVGGSQPDEGLYYIP